MSSRHVDLSHGERGGRGEIRQSLRRGEPAQSLCDPPGIVDVALVEMDVDQQGQQRAGHGRRPYRRSVVFRIRSVPLEEVAGELRLAAGQVNRGERSDGIRVLLESLQELNCLLDTALPKAQIREADEGSVAPRRDAPIEMPGRFGELNLRLAPASCGREDPSVVGAAERGDNVPPLHEVLGRAHPLVRAGNVVDQLARPKERTERRVHDAEVGELTRDGRCQDLVEADQSVLDTVGQQEDAAEIGQRIELDGRIAEPAADGARFTEHGLPDLHVLFCEGVDDQDPSGFGCVLARLLEDAAGARQPSALHGPVAEDAPADPREPARRAASSRVQAFPSIGGVGTLVMLDSRGVFTLEVQSVSQAFERRARLILTRTHPIDDGSG